MEKVRTIDASVIRLNSNLCDLTILCQEGISLTSVVAEDCRAIEQKIQSRIEGGTWVAKEANLVIYFSFIPSGSSGYHFREWNEACHPDVKLNK